MISTVYPCKIMTFLINLSILIPFLPMGSASKGGFSVEMIHRDFSPKSPFYNPNDTHYQRLHKSLFFYNSKVIGPDPKGPVYRYGGSYLLKMSIGTPPVSIFGTLDTGSDWMWTRCVPCTHCGKQEAPLFDPSKSRSFFRMECHVEACTRFTPEPICTEENKCGFAYDYVDGSYCEGVVGVDLITLDSVSPGKTVRNIIMFGCTHSEGGTLNPKTTGIIGMGAGPTSLVTQLNVTGKFSYCLVQYQAYSSMLNFGESAVVSGPGTVSTPVVYHDGYYLTLKGGSITNGAKTERFNYPSASSGQPGNIVIDSGTLQTYLDPHFYKTMRDGVMSRVFLPPAGPVKGFDLCYNTSSTIAFDAPTITMHFEGADVALNTVNTFVLVRPYTACFAFQPNTKSKGINFFGSSAQINFMVGYDKDKVSFKPVFDCSRGFEDKLAR